ncbi:MAG TPA: nicotinate-nucleotide adenylyltransferase [Gammaproteobacteria bacterium]|nr:nicotinate-nucleotide adenylyltransferase [Gammaproteobacteria bacterium]
MLEKPIGILGGTFDPIHLGHLRLAIELHDTLDLAKVHIVPCFQPVHRKEPEASPAARLAMVQVAVQNEPALLADATEIERQGPSYMIDTLLTLREQHPNTPLCLLLGIDAFLGFTSWHRYEAILENAHLIVAHRPQYHLPTTGMIADLLQARLETNSRAIHERLAGVIILKPITPLEISASSIRKQIAMGCNPRYLLPDAVYEHIKQQCIYQLASRKLP